MSAEVQTKKRHHYVPEFYLKGFTDPFDGSCLWVYEKGKSAPFKTSPGNAGLERHYYTVERPDGTRDTNSVEDMYNLLETSAAAVIRKINSRLEIDGQDKSNLAFFIAFQITRVPKFRQNVEAVDGASIKHFAASLGSDKEAFCRMIQSYEQETGKKISGDPEKLRQYMMSNRYKIEVEPQASLPIALQLPNTIWQPFAAMKWRFLLAPNDYRFITSDSPVFWCDPRRPTSFLFEIGLMDRKVEVSLPLTRDTALIASWGGREGYKDVKSTVVRDLNRRSILGSARFVYSSENRDWIPRAIRKYGAPLDLSLADL